ncbi:MAG: Holliday junction branch migration protein RuvA, partial [Succinivibrio sp.]
MIGSLKGRVLRIDGVTALVEVMGVGYEVDIPASSMDKVLPGNDTFLYIHHSVREDAQQLYGFVTHDERALFRILIKVNGVGPKMALAVLSTFDTESFVQTVISGQSKSLEQIPGVGRKTAERMVVELKDKLENLGISAASESSAAVSGSTNQDNFSDAVAALVGLGYRENEAVKYVKAVTSKASDLSVQQVIVQALA